VKHALVAARAEFLPLHPLGVLPAVLVLEIVPTLTVGAFNDDFFSRHFFLSRASGRMPEAIG
jgi:hypothetical protein